MPPPKASKTKSGLDFVTVGAHLVLPRTEYQTGAIQWIRDTIDSRYGTECASDAAWVKLDPLASIRASIIADAYQAVPFRKRHCNTIRLCHAATTAKECADPTCWCKDNVMHLAPVLYKSECVYGFANCNREHTEALLPPRGGAAILEVDVAARVAAQRCPIRVVPPENCVVN